MLQFPILLLKYVGGKDEGGVTLLILKVKRELYKLESLFDLC